jgi:hypothetical protein
MTYWGTTIGHSMFCDLPINSKGVECFNTTKNLSAVEIFNAYSPELKTAKIKWISRKVKKHEKVDFGHPSRYNEFMSLQVFKTLETDEKELKKC